MKNMKIVIISLLLLSLYVPIVAAVDIEKRIGDNAHWNNWSGDIGFLKYKEFGKNFGIIRDQSWWSGLEQHDLTDPGWNDARWDYSYFPQVTPCGKTITYQSGDDNLVRLYQDDNSPELLYLLNVRNDKIAKIDKLTDAQYRDYVYHIVERYDDDGNMDLSGLKKPVKFFEVGNEVDINRYSDKFNPPCIDTPDSICDSRHGYLTPENYVTARLKPAYLAAKSANESSIIISSGLGMNMKLNGDPILNVANPFNTDYLEAMLKAIEDAGGKENNYYMDKLGMHYYADTSKPENFDDDIKKVKTVLQNHNIGDKPIWITEYGSDHISRLMTLMYANGIEISISYDTVLDVKCVSDQEKPTTDMTSPKMKEVITNANLLQDLKPSEKENDNSLGSGKIIYQRVFKNSNKKVTVSWFIDSVDPSAKTTKKIPIGFNSVKLLDMYGNSLTPIIINENGINEVILEIGEKPIYLIEEMPKISPLDMVFVIDTTGSMWDDIAQVKLYSTIIVNAIDFLFKDKYRIAVVDYRDFPIDDHGVPGIDYPYKLDLHFSNTKSEIISKILNLDIGNGLDWDESAYTALVKTIKDESKDSTKAQNYGWRNGVNKVIILMTDAPPHDQDPVSDECDNGCTINDVAYWSKKIDPVNIYGIAIGSDMEAYSALSQISKVTGGEVFTASEASEVPKAILEAIGDIGIHNRGVSVNITPALVETNAGSSATYSVNITNEGVITDTYNISVHLNNIVGYRAYPLAIQPSWIIFDNTPVGLDSGRSKIRPLAINIPSNWAGMNDTIYSFNITANSITDGTVSNTSSAELKIKANKRSMAEYSKLEIQWLSELANSSSIDHGIKNALLAKLANARSKVDTAIANIENGNNEQANNMLRTSQNIMNAFINQVDAQYGKRIMQPDANVLIEKANEIVQDIEKTKNI